MQLCVVMRVDVDEAGGDHRAVGVELDAAAVVDASYVGDAVRADGNVRGVGREPAAVDDGCAAYDEVRTHATAAERAATSSSMR